ncbi:unnamed protein product [Didymodactylos carnosus]|nr:unnamed protein product [Didymodactylos carnosus]CAF4335952.1 unnamed protein product [Didymodactylos carnosus]
MFNVAFLNVKGLVPHFKDVSNHFNLLRADVIGLAESWLSSSNYVNGIQLNVYNVIHRIRKECRENAYLLRSLVHGGVGIYIKV